MSRFVDCLLDAPTPVIMEIKRRSAHGEDLLRDRSTREIVEDYHRLGAPCLSVVTGAWFGGDEHLLREVTAATSRPVLRKDFITREREVIEAKAMGASAVLLIAGLLPASLLRRLTNTALRNDVTPFVEVTCEADLERVSQGHGCVIAVNNKDIRDRERGTADIGRSLSLLPALRQTGARVAVSASGIESPEVASRLLAAGYDALLIGTGLLRAGDLHQWLTEITRRGQASLSRQNSQTLEYVGHV